MSYYSQVLQEEKKSRAKVERPWTYSDFILENVMQHILFAAV